MTEALRVFDQVTETAMPDESYWPGYETDCASGCGPSAGVGLGGWRTGSAASGC